MMKTFAFLFLAFISCPLIAAAQTSDRERGAELFSERKYAEAAEAFQKSIRLNGADVETLFYLAQAFEKLDKPVQAAENYALCYRKGLDVAEKLLAQALAKTQAKEISGYWKYVNDKGASKFEIGLKSAERLRQIAGKNSLPKDLEKAAAIFKFFTSAPKTSEDWADGASGGGTNKAKISKKPPARYTKQAIENRTYGEVQLYVMLLASGEIGFVIPKKSLPDGLTESAIEAAQKIIFEPAIKNGEPATVIYVLAYDFSI